jgi:hypothetical protein
MIYSEETWRGESYSITRGEGCVSVLLLGTALAMVEEDSGVRGSLEQSRLLKATPVRGATYSKIGESFPFVREWDVP